MEYASPPRQGDPLGEDEYSSVAGGYDSIQLTKLPTGTKLQRFLGEQEQVLLCRGSEETVIYYCPVRWLLRR
jgi:hypothetical protein